MGDLPGDVGQVVAIDHHPPLAGGDFRRNQLDEGGLARSGRANQKDKLPIVNAHIDPLQSLGPVVIFLIYVNKANHTALCSLRLVILSV